MMCKKALRYFHYLLLVFHIIFSCFLVILAILGLLFVLYLTSDNASFFSELDKEIQSSPTLK